MPSFRDPRDDIFEESAALKNKSFINWLLKEPLNRGSFRVTAFQGNECIEFLYHLVSAHKLDRLGIPIVAAALEIDESLVDLLSLKVFPCALLICRRRLFSR